MMERLISRLVEEGIPTISLYAEPNVLGLYEKLGEILHLLNHPIR